MRATLKTQKLMKAVMVVVVLSLLFTLTGCGGSAVVGKWKSTNAQAGDTMEFFSDGTVVSTLAIGIPVTGSYKIVDNTHLRMEMGGLLGLAGAQVYEFAIAGDRLTLTIMGVKAEYQRVK